MPVLLLAQGDPEARDNLRRAIEARYGPRPPVLDSLFLEFRGRANVKLGPVHTWVPFDLKARFDFPRSMRWDYTARPLKMPLLHGAEAVHGDIYRSQRGDRKPDTIEDEEEVRSMRRRLWAFAAVLLTPLSDYTVRLTTTGERSFKATNTELDASAEICLRDDHSLEMVQLECLNAEAREMQRFYIQTSTELASVDDLLLPAQLTIGWNDSPYYEARPVNVATNTIIPDAIFKLEK